MKKCSTLVAALIAELGDDRCPEEIHKFLRDFAGSEHPPCPRILVSACLLGHRVTYRDCAATRGAQLNHVIRRLGDLQVVKLLPLCPEVHVLSLGVPRPPARLWSHSGDISMKLEGSSVDLLPDLRRKAALILRCGPSSTADDWLPLHGYIGRDRSPSCAVGNARTYAALRCSVPTTWNHSDGAFASLLHEILGNDARHLPLIGNSRLAKLLELHKFLSSVIRLAVEDCSFISFRYRPSIRKT